MACMVRCAMTRGEVDEDLETGIVVFERHGLNTSRTNTECLPYPSQSSSSETRTVVVAIIDCDSYAYDDSGKVPPVTVRK